MAIKLVEDLGAPAAVAVVDLTTKSMLPKYNEYIVYGMTALGYIGSAMGWGGGFLKNVGIASLPLSAEKIYERMKGTTVAHTVSVVRAPAPSTRVSRSYQGGFEKASAF